MGKRQRAFFIFISLNMSSTNNNLDNNRVNLLAFLEIFSKEGGIQSYVKDIFRGYQSLASSKQVPPAEILLLRDGPESINPFESRSLKFSYLKTEPVWLGRLRMAATLFWFLLWRRPQQVFCGHINLAPLVRTFCLPLGIPYAVLTYGKEVWAPLPAKAQTALAEAASIWTISRYSRDRCCENNNLDPDKFQLLPCMVDGDRFTPGPKRESLIEKYNLHGAKVLMTVARLWSGDIYKGVDVTIRALPAIAEKFPEVKYLVVGRGDDRPRLEKLALDLGMGDRVVFAGFVPTEDLVEHYRLADGYVMPSQEGFGIVYLEAMACGVPVLAGDADGSADPLQDGKLGWRVPHRDPEAVAAACLELLAGEDRRCDGEWLREETIRVFGSAAFAQRLKPLLSRS